MPRSSMTKTFPGERRAKEPLGSPGCYDKRIQSTSIGAPKSSGLRLPFARSVE